METIRPIKEILDLDMLQRIQDEFAEATGMGFVTVDYQGTPIIKPSGFTDFCKLVRKKSNLCQTCDAHAGLRAKIEGKPTIYRCHTGLVDFAVPLCVNGDYCGALLGGQIFCSEKNSVDIKEKLIEEKTDWEAYTDLCIARKQIKTIPISRIKAYLKVIQTTIEYLLNESYNNVIIDEIILKNNIILGEKEKIADLELGFNELKEQSGLLVLENSNILNYLSVISDIAYLENAQQTQDSLYLLSHLLRHYYKKNEENVININNQMDYIKSYLAMEKIRIGDKLKYSISDYEDYKDINLPLNIVRPIIENAIKYTIEPFDDGGEINISFTSDSEHLFIAITDTGQGFPNDVIDNIMNDENVILGGKNRYELFRINKLLMFIYGKNYKLNISNNKNGVGATVVIMLPLNNWDGGGNE
ncbi:MAG: PocR ligand-binding domain-containing protein [Peptostreptococcaceae bacterium]|nr:PocR ligand-binding domain-containing protein [Peptostreptococcaceae bacterium]